MRMLERNKQKMLYSLHLDRTPTYERDEDGNIVYKTYVDSDGNEIPILDDDGNKIPLMTGYKEDVYSDPVEMKANISFSNNNEVQAQEFGLSVSDYDAVIVVSHDAYPLTETSLVWFHETPKYGDDGTVDGNSATFKVVAVKSSLNIDKIILRKVTK